MTESVDKKNPILWIAGEGFGGRTKKLILPKGKLLDVSPKKLPEDRSAAEVNVTSARHSISLRENLVQFLSDNILPIGFVAWTGYKIEGLGRGVVFCDAAQGLEAEAMQIEYLPASAVVNLLQDQGLPDSAIHLFTDELNAYVPEEVCICMVYIEGRVFPIHLSERSPLDCFREMVEAANVQPAKPEDENA